MIPATPTEWVAHFDRVGKGLPALQYLSRYLYRGVISNQQILHDDGEYVTFEYQHSDIKKRMTRRVRGEDYIALALQHTLQKGFRRARDYSFLHGNAKRLLQRVQWQLRVVIPVIESRQRPPFRCKQCQAPMVVVAFKGRQPKPG